jgi:hypothetical protein
VVAVPPDNRNDDAVPEGPDTTLAARVDALGVLPAEDFEAQRWPENANHTVDDGGDKGNLDAAGPGQVGEARVVMLADGFLSDFFGGILRGIGECGGSGVGVGHGFRTRLLRRRRDV